MDYMGNPNAERAKRSTPSSEIIVRPVSMGSVLEAVDSFFSPYGWSRPMREYDPTYKSTSGGFSTSCSAQYGYGGDPGIETWGSVRFCSPRDGDLDPAGAEGGYWCLRSHRYLVSITASMSRGQVYFGETGNSLGGMRVTAWLVDQYFDESQISWNNRAQIAESGYKIEFYLSAELAVEYSDLTATYNFMLDLPDLADGSGPPKIYGYKLKVANEPAEVPAEDETINHTATCTMAVKAWHQNARRGTDSETGIPVPSTLSPRWTSSGWLIGGAFQGYLGEWETKAYIPNEPYAFARQINTTAPHIDPNDKLGIVTCVQDSSVEIELLAVDPNGINAGLVYWIVSGPFHGVLSGLYPTQTYTPTPGFTGSDLFSWKVSDIEGNFSNTVQTIIVVAP